MMLTPSYLFFLSFCVNLFQDASFSLKALLNHYGSITVPLRLLTVMVP